MFKIREEFNKNDYVLLENPLGLSLINLLHYEYDLLVEKARCILDTVNGKVSLAEFYKNNLDQLIVIPEGADCLEVCRFEYIAASSKIVNEVIIKELKTLIEDLMGKPFLLFKDKCNVKNPGGGAFPPHQDIAAYYHFKPKFHITAAIMLDDSNVENGCLEMAVGYKDNIAKDTHFINCEFGNFPFFDFYRGGNKNGDIKDEISCTFNWKTVEANKGDIILFNSFVPHCSKKNFSENKRRNFFFTFNLESDGNYYQEYYNRKRKDYGNPIFHVSTPTDHDEKLINRTTFL